MEVACTYVKAEFNLGFCCKTYQILFFHYLICIKGAGDINCRQGWSSSLMKFCSLENMPSFQSHLFHVIVSSLLYQKTQLIQEFNIHTKPSFSF